MLLIKPPKSLLPIPLVGEVTTEASGSTLGPIATVAGVNFFLSYSGRGLTGNPVLSPGHVIKSTVGKTDTGGNAELHYKSVVAYVLADGHITTVKPFPPAAAHDSDATSARQQEQPHQPQQPQQPQQPEQPEQPEQPVPELPHQPQ